MADFELKHRIGIELDVDARRVTPEKLMEVMQPANPLLMLEPHALGKKNERWVVKVCPRSGLKLCSPTLPATNDSLTHIAASLNMLEFDTGIRPISRHCVFHLHIDLSDITINEIAEFMRAVYLIEPVVKQILPPSRRNDDQARLLRRVLDSDSLDLDQILHYFVGRPDLAVDLSSCLSRQCVEIKYASGTTNTNKVNYWIILWCSVLDRVLLHGAPEETIDTVEGLCDYLRWPTDEEEGDLAQARAFWLRRVETLRERRRDNIREE